MRPFLALLSVGGLFVAGGASAQTIYTWVGADGVEHYTDDRSTVPKGAKMRTTEGEHISTLQMDGPKVVPGADAGVAAAAPETPDGDELTWRAQFRDARERVAALEDAVEVDRRQVEEVNGLPLSGTFLCAPWGAMPGFASTTSVGVTAQGQVGPVTVVGTTGAVVGGAAGVAFPPCVYVQHPQWEQVRARLALNRKALERAKGDLADLERRAAFVGVPNEWRR